MSTSTKLPEKVLASRLHLCMLSFKKMKSELQLQIRVALAFAGIVVAIIIIEQLFLK
jgi:hypothetical protein